ncbi:MAG: aminopeptidase N [Pedobacter sp.]|nr:aminopeptidase N [Pedobacter sp.]
MILKTDLTPETTYLKNYMPAPYIASHVYLTFELFEDKTIVKSETLYIKNPANLTNDLILYGQDQAIISVEMDDKLFNGYSVEDNIMTIMDICERFTLTIRSEIDPASNSALEGLYKSQGTYCTQCEAEGFRRITYFQDRPDVLSTFTVRIEGDKSKYPVLLSNGNLMDTGDLDHGRHFAIWNDPFPKPCYLFALVAGNLLRIEDNFKTMSGRNVALHIYVRSGDELQCGHAMTSLKKAMKWDEEKYGREYELDLFNIVAVNDFNMGAMENTSLNIFNTKLVLAHKETATDSDFTNVERVIAHEYFHNWTGNRVTCRDWFQLSLKEGLTVFRDQEFSSDMNSPAVHRIDDVDHLRSFQFSEDASPLAHSVQPDNFIEISNFYTATVYEKGAELIRMQHTLLGGEMYRKATDLYFHRYDGHAVTCDDFVQCMADASGRDMTQFFLWYKQAGTPTLSVNSHYNAVDETYTLSLTQSQTDTPGQIDKKPLHIPVAVGLLDCDGNETHTTRILEMTQPEQNFVFSQVKSRPVPSILRGFSAPVKLTTDLSDDDLRLLQLKDTDGFNKWEAGQTLALRILERVMRDSDANIAQFIEDFGVILEQSISEKGDKALIARAIKLPAIAVIAQSQEVIDPVTIERARTQILKAIKHRHKDALVNSYEMNRNTGEFSISSEAMGRRALQNSLLELLTVSNGNGSAARAKAHYDVADNMTDRVGALTCLSNSEQLDRDKVFFDFYQRFKAYPLVVDKWFSLQASANRDEIFGDFEKLLHHPEFNIKNPNRVRAVYSAFAINNPVKFHDPSGQGYFFLRDAIIELNNINPQIAARLIIPFREWRRYTPALQVKIKEALQTILDTPNLSNDVFEVVSKSLQA